MSGVSFQLDSSQMLALEDKMMKYGANAEEAVNNVIHERGAKLIMMNIINFMPMSKLGTKHAKTSKSLEQRNVNLGVFIDATPKFGYLVFPEMGLGRRNPVEHGFMREGLEKSEDTIIRWIMEALENTPIL